MGQPERENLLPLEASLAAAWPPRVWQDGHVVLAVSGGADSVAMARAMCRIKHFGGGAGRLYVGHLNHGLRGASAADDEAWLVELCGQLSLPLEIGHVDVAALAANEGDGREAAARRARYEFLRGFAERVGARYVATAHTADDQVETVLHRILRGTGIAGLAGIQFARPLAESVTLVRPLLKVRRSEVLQYLAGMGQSYRIDETNADPQYTRNRLRRELLPLLREQYNPMVDETLTRLAAQAGDVQRVIDELVGKLVDCSVHRDAGQPLVIRVDRRPLNEQPASLVREVFRSAWKRANWPLQAMRYHEWEQLAALAQSVAPMAALNLPGNVRAERRGSDVVMQRLA